jgi:chromate transporter
LAFLRLGITAFGGPAMVAYIKELAVSRRQWLDEAEFRNGLVLCQSIPGATAMQMAAYVGLRSRGIKGALASYAGFGLPAFIAMFFLSVLYTKYRNLPLVTSLFNGFQVIVVAIIVTAIYSFGKGMIKNYINILFALISAYLFWIGISPFIVIIAGALAGMIMIKKMAPIASGIIDEKKSGNTYWEQVFFLFLLLAACLSSLYFADKQGFDLAAVMLQIDLFAFGGGFASVPLMLQKVVNVNAWMDYRTFMDGIALGQITPGPIVITATFVGCLRTGLSGALIATIAVFTPSFLILICTFPFFDRLKTTRYFISATDGIVASFLGLLLNVGIRFSTAVPWNMMKMFLGIAVLVALIRKISTLYVVTAGAIFSLFFF